jgi:hypothetical protein
MLLAPPRGFADEVIEVLRGLVVHHRDLLADDLFLGIDLGGVEKGIAVKIGEHFKEAAEFLRGPLHLVGGVILDREAIDGGAKALDVTRDLLCGALLGALEEHVLDEVGHTVFALGLVAAAGPGPDSHGDAGHVWHRDGGETDAVVETGDAGAGRHQGRGKGGMSSGRQPFSSPIRFSTGKNGAILRNDDVRPFPPSHPRL